MQLMHTVPVGWSCHCGGRELTWLKEEEEEEEFLAT
jgi:hypothetical protein